MPLGGKHESDVSGYNIKSGDKSELRKSGLKKSRSTYPRSRHHANFSFLPRRKQRQWKRRLLWRREHQGTTLPLDYGAVKMPFSVCAKRNEILLPSLVLIYYAMMSKRHLIIYHRILSFSVLGTTFPPRLEILENKSCGDGQTHRPSSSSSLPLLPFFVHKIIMCVSSSARQVS